MITISIFTIATIYKNADLLFTYYLYSLLFVLFLYSILIYLIIYILFYILLFLKLSLLFILFTHSLLFILFVLIFIGPWLNTGGTYRIRFVRPSIRPERIFSKTALRFFLKLGMKLGHLRGLDVTWPFFLYILLILLKSTFLALFCLFCSFLDFMKKRL